MKKSKKRDYAKDRHGETCMCRKCRSRIDAVFNRKGQTKIRVRDIKDLEIERYDD